VIHIGTILGEYRIANIGKHQFDNIGPISVCYLGGEVSLAGMDVDEVAHADAVGLPAGTVSVDVIVAADAPAEPHPAVYGAQHQYLAARLAARAVNDSCMRSNDTVYKNYKATRNKVKTEMVKLLREE